MQLPLDHYGYFPEPEVVAKAAVTCQKRRPVACHGCGETRAIGENGFKLESFRCLHVDILHCSLMLLTPLMKFNEVQHFKQVVKNGFDLAQLFLVFYIELSYLTP